MRWLEAPDSLTGSNDSPADACLARGARTSREDKGVQLDYGNIHAQEYAGGATAAPRRWSNLASCLAPPRPPFRRGRCTKVMSSGVKIEKLDAGYDPLADTCIKAFVRLLAARAHSEAGNPTA